MGIPVNREKLGATNQEPLVRTDRRDGTVTFRGRNFWGIPLASQLSGITRELPVAKIVEKLQQEHVLADSPLHNFGLERILLPVFLAKAIKSGMPLEQVCVVIGYMQESDIPINLEKSDGTPSICPSPLPLITLSELTHAENMMPVIEGRFCDTTCDFGPQSDSRAYAVNGKPEQMGDARAPSGAIEIESSGGRIIVNYVDFGCDIHIDEIHRAAVGLSGNFTNEKKHQIDLSAKIAMAQGMARSPLSESNAAAYKTFITLRIVSEELDCTLPASELLSRYGKMFGREELTELFDYSSTHARRIYLGPKLLAFVRERAQMHGLQVQ